MVPTNSDVGALTSVKRDGNTIPTTTRTIKGVDYAFFDAAAGKLRGDLRRRRHRARDLERDPHGSRRREGDDQLGHRRAVGFSGRLRHRSRQPEPDEAELRARQLAHRRAHRPRPEYHLLLPGQLDRRRQQLNDRAVGKPDAAELHNPLREPHRHHHRRLRRRDPGRQHLRLRDRGRRGDPATHGRRGVLRRPGAAFRLVERHLGIAGRRLRRQRDGHRRRAPRRRRLRRRPPPPTAPATRSSSRRTSAAATSPTSASPTTSTTTGRCLQHQGRRQHLRPHERRRSPAATRSFRAR